MPIPMLRVLQAAVVALAVALVAAALSVGVTKQRPSWMRSSRWIYRQAHAPLTRLVMAMAHLLLLRQMLRMQQVITQTRRRKECGVGSLVRVRVVRRVHS